MLLNQPADRENEREQRRLRVSVSSANQLPTARRGFEDSCRRFNDEGTGEPASSVKCVRRDHLAVVIVLVVVVILLLATRDGIN